MTESQTGFADVNGARLWYEVAGAGHPLIMLHGHLLDSGQWDDQFAAFAKDYRVVRYDARGFGQSSMPASPYAHYEDLHGVMQSLGIEHAYLMGCSNGGAATIDFALTYPEMTDALILVDSAISGFEPDGPPPPELVAFQAALSRGDVSQAVEITLQMYTDGPHRAPEQVNQAARERTRALSARLFARERVEAAPIPLDPPAVERLGAISVPAVAIVGDEDNPMIHDIADRIVAQAANARKVVIADAGHHPNMEHPAEFNAVVRAFLGEL